MKSYLIKLYGVVIIMGDVWLTAFLGHIFLKPGYYWYTAPLLLTLICILLVGVVTGFYLIYYDFD